MRTSGVLINGPLFITMAGHVWIAHFLLRFGCGRIAILPLRLTCDYAVHLTH
jgi:hypothetical protein